MWVPAALVLLSAILHVSWNLIVKRGEDKLVSAWVLDLAPPVILWPLLFFTGLPDRSGWAIVLASGLIHAASNATLAEAYERADLSLVYPVARGLAPVFVAVGAGAALGERLAGPAVLGILAVAFGVTWLGLSVRRRGGGVSGLGWAVGLAGLIAAYSLVDKVGVMGMHPVAYAIMFMACGSAILTPYVYARRGARHVAHVLGRQGIPMVAGALIGLTGYVLVLFALRLTHVSYVAALREVSVVLAALVGWRVLGEAFGIQRAAAATLAAGGLIMLSLALAG